MAIQRITHNMMAGQSVGSLQNSLNKLARLQEQLSTGRVINRPSDSPAGTISAMRLRTELAHNTQFGRNAADATAWLQTADSALTTANQQVNRAKDLALQGANSGSMGPTAREALIAELKEIRAGLVDTVNTRYLDRPVFGGTTAGGAAFAADADGVITYAGNTGEVHRTIAEGVRIRVDVDGVAAFGADGDSIFTHIDQLIVALSDNDATGIQQAIDDLSADSTRIVTVQAQAGTRHARAEAATVAVIDQEIALKSHLSEVENADLPQVIVDLQMQEVAYQAALGATSRVISPSLMDFLR